MCERRGGCVQPADDKSPAERDTVIKRRRVGDRLQPTRELLHREERPREQKERDQTHPIDSGEAHLVRLERRVGDDRQYECESRQNARRDHEHGEIRRRRPEGGEDRGVDRTDRKQAAGDRRDVPAQHVLVGKWRRQHREVGLVPLDRVHDRVHRLAGADLHRCRGEEARREEVQVRNAADVADVAIDERSEAESHRREVQHRVQEAGGDRAAPGPLVRVREVHERAEPARPREARLSTLDRNRFDGRHQSMSERPVSLRKTSSRLERRTSAESISIPVR